MLNPAPNPLPGPPHFVDLHVNPGESVSIQFFDGNETVLRGPTTIKMVSQFAYPPMPMPVQVPPGHMIQQVVDEHGTLKHIILSALNTNGAINSGAGTGGGPTLTPLAPQNPTAGPPQAYIAVPGNPTPVVAAAPHQQQYCCCCNNTCGTAGLPLPLPPPPNNAGQLPTGNMPPTAIMAAANHHNAMVFPPPAQLPPPPLNHNAVAAAAHAAAAAAAAASTPGNFVRNRRSGTRHYSSPNKRPSGNNYSGTNNVGGGGTSATNYYGGGGMNPAATKGGGVAARYFVKSDQQQSGIVKSANQYHRYLNAAVQQPFDRANYAVGETTTSNHTGGGGGGYYAKYAADHHHPQQHQAYHHHSSNHVSHNSSATLDHHPYHAKKYYRDHHQPQQQQLLHYPQIQYGGGVDGGTDNGNQAAAITNELPRQPIVDHVSNNSQENLPQKGEVIESVARPLVVVEEIAGRPSTAPIVEEVEEEMNDDQTNHAKPILTGDQSNVDNEQDRNVVASDVVDSEGGGSGECASDVANQTVIEPVIYSANDNEETDERCDQTSDIVVVSAAVANEVQDRPQIPTETKMEKKSYSVSNAAAVAVGSEKSKSRDAAKKLPMANGHCGGGGSKVLVDKTEEVKSDSDDSHHQHQECELSKSRVSGSTTSSNRSPKQMLPKIEALTLTCSNVSSTSIRLKWCLSRPNNEYPAEQKRHYIVDQTSLTGDDDTSTVATGSSNRMAYQGPNMSCRVGHLQPQHEYEFRVRTNTDRAVLISNVVTVVTPESTPSGFNRNVRRTNKQLHHQVNQQQQLIHQQQQQLLQHQQQIMEQNRHHQPNHRGDRKHSHGSGGCGSGGTIVATAEASTALNFGRRVASAAEKMITPMIGVSSEQGCALLIVAVFTIVSLVVAVLINHLLGNHW